MKRTWRPVYWLLAQEYRARRRWISSISTLFMLARTVGAFQGATVIPRTRYIPCQALSAGRSSVFPHSEPPLLAIITEETACHSRERLERAIETLSKAVSTNQVDLVSVRIKQQPAEDSAAQQARVVELTRRLVALSAAHGFRVVVSSDWLDAAADGMAHGVHVKEAAWPSMLPAIQERFAARGANLLLGTSVHSLASARRAVGTPSQRPDYVFVGTCYATASHPEKTANDGSLEGPELPGAVRRDLETILGPVAVPPRVFAIGGIDATNCREPVATYGADGVAVIRAVSGADDPAEAVRQLKHRMRPTAEADS